MASSEIDKIEVNIDSGSFDVNADSYQSESLSLGCSVTIEDIDSIIQEIRLDDIVLSGTVVTDEISVDIDSDRSNYLDLDVSVCTNGVNSTIVQSQVVTYDKILGITDLSPEFVSEKKFAASALSVKKTYDSLSLIEHRINIAESRIEILEMNQGGGGGGSASGDGFWSFDKSTGEVYITKPVRIENNLIVWGDTTSGGSSDSSAVGGAIENLSDVELSSLSNGDILKYNLSSGKWENSPLVLPNNIATQDWVRDNFESKGVVESFESRIARLEGFWVEEDDSLVTNRKIRIKNNLIVDGDTASGGVGDSESAAGASTILVNGEYYYPSNGVIDLSPAFANIELDNYYTKQEIDRKDESILSYVDGKYNGIDFSPYALKTELADISGKVDINEGHIKTLQAWKTSFDALISLEDGAVRIKGNLIIDGDTASGGEGSSDVNVGINEEQLKEYLDANKYVTEAWIAEQRYVTLATYATGVGQLGNRITTIENSYVTGSTLASYALKSEIPTSLPASDVYAWAKKSSLALADVPDLSSKYLPKSGGTIDGSSSSPLKINTSSTTIGIPLSVSNVNKAWMGWSAGQGVYLWNAASNKYLGIEENGTPYYDSYTLIHSGNIGSQTVAAANKLVSGGVDYITYNSTYGQVLIKGVSIGYGNNTIENATGGNLNIQLNATGNTCINTYGGNVGIGTASPAYKLDIFSDNFLCVQLARNKDAGYGAAILAKNNANTLGIFGWNKEDDFLINAGGTNSATGTILFRASSSVMQLNSTYVGIGTSSPTYKLEVNGVARATGWSGNNVNISCDANGDASGYSGEINRFGGGQLYIQTRSGLGALNLGNASGGVKMYGAVSMSSTLSVGGSITPSEGGKYNLGSASLWYERIYGRYIDTQSGYNLRICVAGNEAISIAASSQNVGIGNTNPQYKLDVSGNQRISGNLIVTGDVAVA